MLENRPRKKTPVAVDEAPDSEEEGAHASPASSSVDRAGWLVGLARRKGKQAQTEKQW